MFIKSRFFYNAEGGEGGGTLEGDQTQNQIVIPEEISKELEELRAFRKSIQDKPAEPTEEEKKRAEELDKADFIKFSTENNLMKVDEFSKLDMLKAKADRDLVFENYIKDWKEENPDADPEEADSLAKQDFEAEFKLNSENAKAKERGEARLKKEAELLRSPLERTYSKAQEEFSRAKTIKSAIKPYNEFIDSAVDSIPSKKVFFTHKDGEDDIKIEVELSSEDREELKKIFKNEKTFYDFRNSKPEELSAKLEKKFNSYIREKKHEEIGQQIFKVAHDRGLKKGSDVGAANPFPLIQNKTKEFKPSTLEESNEKIAKARERHGR